MLEKQIEKKVKEYARSRGWAAYKFVSPNNRGVSDCIMFKDSQTVFIEFKQKGKKPTKLQEKFLAKMDDQGFITAVIDSIEGGKEFVDALS